MFVFRPQVIVVDIDFLTVLSMQLGPVSYTHLTLPTILRV